MKGWIKIHRKITQWEWYKDSHTLHLFLHLLLKANTEDGIWQGVPVKRGQLITGRLKISQETGLSESASRMAIRKLTKCQQITSHTTNRFTLITICNFDSYQENITDNNQPNDQQITSGLPADYQPHDHKQEVRRKEDILVRQKTLSSIDDRKRKFVDEVMAFKSIYPDAMLNEFYTYWTEQNPAKTKMRFEMNKTWQTSLRLKTWANREKVTNGTTNGHKPVEFLKTNKKISV